MKNEVFYYKTKRRVSMEKLKSVLHYNEKESKIYMPNEIFYDLGGEIEDGNHIPFAYSYIYLCTWLYRHTKHFNPDVYDNNIIKQILGYDKSNRTLNYLIKKNGLLDEIGYLESVRDFPISWEIEDKQLVFHMFSDYPDYPVKMSNRFFLKYPVTAFTRKELDNDEYYMEGTFYNVTNTHMIPFEVFLFCMSKKELGVSAFYMYSYLKYRCDVDGGKCDISISLLSDELKLSLTTTKKYLSLLKSYKMIDFFHNQDYFVAGMSKEDRKSNSYMTRKWTDFSDVKVDYKKIKQLTREEYDEILKNKDSLQEEIENNLPF